MKECNDAFANYVSFKTGPRQRHCGCRAELEKRLLLVCPSKRTLPSPFTLTVHAGPLSSVALFLRTAVSHSQSRFENIK